MSSRLIHSGPYWRATLRFPLPRRNQVHSSSERLKSTVVGWGFNSNRITNYETKLRNHLSNECHLQWSNVRLAAGASHYMIGFTTGDDFGKADGTWLKYSSIQVETQGDKVVIVDDEDDDADVKTEATSVKDNDTATKDDAAAAKVGAATAKDNAMIAKGNGTNVKTDGTNVKDNGTNVKSDGTNVKDDDTNVKVDDTNVKVDDTNVKVDDTNVKIDDTNVKDGDTANKDDGLEKHIQTEFPAVHSGVYIGGTNISSLPGLGITRDKNGIVFINGSGRRIEVLACGREHSMILSNLFVIHGQLSNIIRLITQGFAILAFGNSTHGQLGVSLSKYAVLKDSTGPDAVANVIEPNPTQVILPDPADHVVQVECGLDHTIFLTDKGDLYAMGLGKDGQLGLGPESSSDRALPTLIERLSWRARGKEVGRVKKISCSTNFTLALLENNQLWIWGKAEHGQCMTNKTIDRIMEPMHIPHPIPEAETIVSVAAGGTFGLLLTQSGKVYTCGYGALGLGHDKTQALMPEQIDGLSDIRKIVATTDYAAAIDNKGNLYTWGICGDTGRLGHINPDDRRLTTDDCYEPKRVVMPQELKGHKVTVRDVALGQDGALAFIAYGAQDDDEDNDDDNDDDDDDDDDLDLSLDDLL
ncbi:regulator of chromosome condensation 1/beta-lactamase-inhibitor protein II [Mortierella sp. GBAus27b]|nr:regulator of chromosome condensation 1/beta-lactamase-inhibitor protein II [Mortierella sp. GBAus27b]